MSKPSEEFRIMFTICRHRSDGSSRTNRYPLTVDEAIQARELLTGAISRAMEFSPERDDSPEREAPAPANLYRLSSRARRST